MSSIHLPVWDVKTKLVFSYSNVEFYVRKRIIAPRLFSGEKRDSIGHGLPPEIKSGLKAIAKSENSSVSWVLEKIIIDYFGFKTPRYVNNSKPKRNYK